jgi:hypothetical protein
VVAFSHTGLRKERRLPHFMARAEGRTVLESPKAVPHPRSGCGLHRCVPLEGDLLSVANPARTAAKGLVGAVGRIKGFIMVSADVNVALRLAWR